MKTKLLTAAIAAASVMASGMAVAGGHGHGSNAIKTALANATVGGEVYGAYRNSTSDNGTNDTDASDFDLDIVRLSLNTTLKQDVELGLEIEHSLGDGFGGNSPTLINELFAAKSYGNTVVTVGRFKQIADREDYIEMSDRVFNDMSTGVLGTMRRIDGIEVKSHNDTGLHGSFSLYKGGVETETKSNGDFESSRKFGIAGSVGWVGGNDDMRFGGTLSLAQEDGNENTVPSPGISSDGDSTGISVETFIATGPIVAALNYGDGETENTTSAPSKNESESDAVSVWGAWNLSNAQRTFNEYGVLQGPKLAAGDMGYEVGFMYSTGSSESKLNGTVTNDQDNDSWGLAFNLYCGSYTKWFATYTSSEIDVTGGAKFETDAISLGARLDF